MSGLSPQQLAMRAEGISGTDIGAIAGLSPWKRPVDVWLEKTGRATNFVGNERTKWGTLLEPTIRKDYEERHEVRVEVPGTLRHPDHSWWLGSPDGLVYRTWSANAEKGMEIKVHGREALLSGGLTYGAPGSDEVPPHELVQCLWYMGVTGLDRWDLVAFLDGAPVEYVIDRDDELLGQLAERAERFLVDHVQADVAPEIDGSKSWDAWLARRWDKNLEGYVDIDADADKLRLVGELRAAREASDAADDLLKAAVQRVKVIVADRAGLMWKEPGFKTPRRIHWKFSKASAKTDYEAAIAKARTDAALLLGARGEEIERAIRIIKSAPAGSTISDGPDTMPTSSVVELLELLQPFVGNIAHGIYEKEFTREVPGPRVFNVPRSWGKDKEG